MAAASQPAPPIDQLPAPAMQPPAMPIAVEQPSSVDDSAGQMTQFRPPATLTSLPPELLLSIIEYVRPCSKRDRDYSTLANLTRVNRLFYTLALDYLYEEFHIDRDFGRPDFYLRTLMDNPGIAERVRRLNFKLPLFLHLDVPGPFFDFLESRLLANDIYVVSPHFTPDPGCRSPFVYDRAFIIAILLHTARLTHFSIRDPESISAVNWVPSLFQMTFSFSTGSGIPAMPAEFAHLRSISMHLGFVRTYGDCHQLRPVFHLPSLETLWVQAAGCLPDFCFPCPDREAPVHSSPIRDLTFGLVGAYDSKIENAAYTIDRCRSLKRLAHYGRYEDDAQFAVLSRAIRHHRESLTHLRIHAWGEWGETVMQDREAFGEVGIHERSKIGSLAEFSSLESIVIPPELLSGYPIRKRPESFMKSLPTGLKEIELNIFTDDPVTSDTTSSYLDFAAVAKNHCPNLERLAFYFTSPTHRLSKAERKLLGHHIVYTIYY